VIDYPFDGQDHTVRDDIAKIETFLSEEEPTRTICWLPSFFNHETLEALGTFVRLEQILKENQFPSYVQHLTETDRDIARSQLETQRDQLRGQIVARIEMAYGIRGEGQDYLDQANTLEPAEHFRGLDPGVTLQPPAAANLEQGLQGILDQALRQQFSAHPHFEERLSLTKGTVGKVLETVRNAAQSSEPSVLVETSQRKQMSQIANPLKLGEMGEQRFQLGQHWKNHFNKQIAQASGDLSVGKLRKWIDLPEATGLPEILQDLVILAYAEQTNRVFKHHGGPTNADLGTLEDAMTLEEVSLPSEADWQTAGERAKATFGIPASPLLNAANVTAVGESVRERVKEWISPVHSLIGRLEALQSSRFQNGKCPRLETTREALSLLKTLEAAAGNSLISQLATYSLEAKPAVLGVALSSSLKLDQALEMADWEIFDGIAGLTDDRKDAADEVWSDLRDAFNSDEYAIALVPKLSDLRQRAVKLLTKSVPPPIQPPVEPPIQPILPPSPPEPPVRTATELKELYGASQVNEDALPDWLSDAAKADVLRVHCFGSDPGDWKSLVVVTPLIETLIRMDEGAKVDLSAGTLSLPKFSKEFQLQVKPEHLDS
jgi:hypothetical protein